MSRENEDEIETEPIQRPATKTNCLGTFLAVLLCWLIIGAVLLLCTAGCTQQDRSALRNRHVQTITRTWTDASGVTTTLTETHDVTNEESQTKSGFDPAITSGIGQGVKAVTAAATGDWSNAIALGAGAIATIAAGWAGKNAGKVGTLQQRVEEHKQDSAEGWAKFEQAMKAREA